MRRVLLASSSFLLALTACTPEEVMMPEASGSESGEESVGDENTVGDGDGDGPGDGDGEGPGDGDGEGPGDGDGEGPGDGDGDGPGDGDGEGPGDGDGDGPGDGDGDGPGDGDGDEPGDGDGDEPGDGDGDEPGDGDGDEPWDGNPNNEPCEEWLPTHTRAYGLEKIWTDGLDLYITGSSNIVTRVDGVWTDIEAATVDRHLNQTFDIWGPAGDDHWLLGFATSYGHGVFHSDGAVLDAFTELPDPGLDPGQVFPTDISGAAPDDLWLAGIAECDTFTCQDPDCECNAYPSVLMHFDGVDWAEVESPGMITQIWSDGTSTWGVGGRPPAMSPWLTPRGGTVASFDGSEWTIWAEGDLPPLYAVWATGNEDVWVGGEAGTLRHFALGMQTDHSLPTQAAVVRIEGRGSDEIWALDDSGQLWAWAGVEWTPYLLVEHARDFAVLDEGLVLVGSRDGSFGHEVTLLDLDTDQSEVLYMRDNFWPQTIVADSMSSAVASHVEDPGTFNRSHGETGSWRWDGSSWQPTYEGFDAGFYTLTGAVDQGFGTRASTGPVLPSFHPVYAIENGVISEVPTPLPDSGPWDAELFEFQGNQELWVAGAFPSFYLRVWDGEVWEDRMPPGDPLRFDHLAQGGERVFGNSLSRTMMWEAGVWTDISHPEDNFFSGMAATGPEELWATAWPDGLFFWDGQDWSNVADLWPQMAEFHHGWTLDARRPDDMWLVSSNFFEPNAAAHWDGEGWEIITTPPSFTSWSERQRILVETVPEGVIMHDGINLWRYRWCG